MMTVVDQLFVDNYVHSWQEECLKLQTKEDFESLVNKYTHFLKRMSPVALVYFVHKISQTKEPCPLCEEKEFLFQQSALEFLPPRREVSSFFTLPPEQDKFNGFILMNQYQRRNWKMEVTWDNFLKAFEYFQKPLYKKIFTSVHFSYAKVCPTCP